MQTVYLDILFLINFSMDLLCFYLASRIMSVRMPVPRAVLASVLGGIYADAALCIAPAGVMSLVIDLLVCFLMCAFVFGKRNGFFFPTIVYFSVSMALGGFMSAIFNLLNRMGMNKAELREDSGDGISVWLFAILAAVSGLMTLAGGRFFRRSSSQKRVELNISYEEKQTRLCAMVDSGNLLREPISGRACVALDSKRAEEVFCHEIAVLSRLSGVDGGTLSSLSGKNARRVRLVPTSTASGSGMLIGVRADRVTVVGKKGEYEVDCIIVLCPMPKDSSPTGVSALVPCELVR